MEPSKTNSNLIVVGQKICISAEIGCHWDKQSKFFPYVIIMIKLESPIFFLDYFQYKKLPKRLNYDTATKRRTLKSKKKPFDPSLVTKEEIKID